ncbi:MAG: hypothetical protein AAGA78_13150, partial [Pseudomonadota bacterium]
DLTKRLPVGDPDDRDLKVGCGTAVEGTVLALAKRGIGAQVTWLDDEGPSPRPFARVTAGGTPHESDVDLAAHVHKRTTHRAGFLPVQDTRLATLSSPHVTLVTDPADIAWLSNQIDRASALLLRDPALRRELLDWMRLSRGQTGYESEGLNRETLCMDGLTARIARPVLGSSLYDALSRLGLGPALSGERARTSSASAIALFHWPADGSLFEAGRAFYRTWLEATALGLVGWPAAALADHAETKAEVSARFGVPTTDRLINTLRLGRAKGATPSRTRLAVSEVIN